MEMLLRQGFPSPAAMVVLAETSASRDTSPPNSMHDSTAVRVEALLGEDGRQGAVRVNVRVRVNVPAKTNVEPDEA